MGIVSGAGAHSLTTAGRQDISRSSPPRSLRDHNGLRTYDRSPTTRSQPAPENPVSRKKIFCLYDVNSLMSTQITK